VNLKRIDIKEFSPRIFELFDDDWLLLTCGDYAAGDFNAMTISWGSMGIVWNRPFVQVLVRPVRYTFEFMNRYPDFTLCAFDEEHRPALNLLGTQSGRDSNKNEECGLTPKAASMVASPCFAEATLVIECRKLFWQDIDPAHFIDPGIENHYPEKDYHRMFFGEIVALAREG